MTSAFTVSQLTNAIKARLEPHFRAIAVQGEITNFKQQSSGHLYFSLKDPEAQISAVLFRGSAAKIARMPKDGDQVIAIGEISIYAPRGNYQLVIRELQFLGLGELLLRFQRMKEELAKRGWFEQSRKRPLPAMPKRIGVVTSPTGAVILDILNILKRRFAGFHLILNPVKVQGEGSAQEIARAIEDFNRYNLADVLIVGRGGGSLEDLWAFNEEIVAKAILESKIPVISAVGHETDFTISDMVADVRAPTPSAAAEIVLKEKEQLLKFLHDAKARVTNGITQTIQARKQRLKDVVKQPVFYSPYALLGQKMQRLDDWKGSLDVSFKRLLEKKNLALASYEKQLQNLQPMRQITALQEKVKNYEARLDASWNAALNVRKGKWSFALFQKRIEKAMLAKMERSLEKLKTLSEHLRSLDPKSLLKKGYSILFSEKDHSIILSAKAAQEGDAFYALMADGKIHATIRDKEHD